MTKLAYVVDGKIGWFGTVIREQPGGWVVFQEEGTNRRDEVQSKFIQAVRVG